MQGTRTMKFSDVFPLSRTPSPKAYFDSHIHVKPIVGNIYTIVNLDNLDELDNPSFLGVPVSIGVHPWFYDSFKTKKHLDIVKKFAGHPCVLAIGECGIDRTIKTPLQVQEKNFIFQAELAELRQKPLLIHCVKAYADFAGIIQRFKPTVPWIFHGFNANAQIAQSVLEYGAYLSVGRDLLRQNSKIRNSFTDLPTGRIFFETDNWFQPVSILYKEAALLTKKTQKDLKQQMFDNFVRCFILKKDHNPD
jgi:TatD DNase family protein